MGVAVDEPGEHAPALGVVALVGRGGAGVADCDHAPVFEGDGRVAAQAERAVAQLGGVGDEEPDVVDDQAGAGGRSRVHRALIASASSAATSRR